MGAMLMAPADPHRAMQEAAKIFGAANNGMVNVAAGPTAQWLDKATQDADVVFSGAENMMSDFAKALSGAFTAICSNLTEFTEFLLSPAGSKTFATWGWDACQ